MAPLSNRSFALVGGAGFIGHHLALRLRQLGAAVTVIDSLAVNNYHHFKSNRAVLPSAALYLGILEHRLALLSQAGIPLIELDARDYHALSRAFTRVDPDTVFHLAAVSHADKSNRDPLATFDHSLRTLENSLDNARSKSLAIGHFVYFSSSTIYGNFKADVVTEDTPCEPIGIYAALKLAGERMVIAYNQVFGTPYTIVRPSALYGPRCVSRRIGQILIENALQGLEVSIQGDGNDRLDFTYVDDLVDGLIRVVSNEAAKNQTFNMTYGQSRSINEMAEIVKRHFPEVRFNRQPRDRLMPKRGTLSIEKARRLLGYEPMHPLEKGFVEYIHWYKSIWQQFGQQQPEQPVQPTVTARALARP
jgi:nucleoside-diphosphate-sugar epimerase